MSPTSVFRTYTIKRGPERETRTIREEIGEGSGGWLNLTLPTDPDDTCFVHAASDPMRRGHLLSPPVRNHGTRLVRDQRKYVGPEIHRPVTLVCPADKKLVVRAEWIQVYPQRQGKRKKSK